MALTYREAIAEALRSASAALERGDTGAVRNAAHWAHWYSHEAYGASPSKRAADLDATLDTTAAYPPDYVEGS